MSDLDTLRPEVRNAVEGLDLFCGDDDPDWEVVRAELLRLDALEQQARALNKYPGPLTGAPHDGRPCALHGTVESVKAISDELVLQKETPK